MKKLHTKHLWYILGAYGVWFAIFSGFEEMSHGKFWKAVSSILLGILVYYIIEIKNKN